MDKWMRSKTFVQVVALVLGILLWAVVHVDQQSPVPGNSDPSNQNQTMIFSNVQVSVVGVDPDQYHIRSIDPAYVNVTVDGKSTDIRNINNGVLNNKIVLDLTELSEGTHQQVPLQSTGYPEDVEVFIDPPAVSVVIEKIRQKEVPVEVVIKGEPREGFRAGIPIVQPSRVNVAVPESQMNNIVKVQATVNIAGANEAVLVEKNLVAINANGQEVEAVIQPSVAQITIPITSPFKTIPLQIKFNGEVPQGFAIADFEQSVDKVTIYGAENDIDPYEFYGGIVINIADLNRAQNYTYTYNIPLQQQIHQILPEKVDVQIRVVRSGKKILEDVPVILVGTNEEVITEVLFPENGQFDLELEGAPELLEDVKEEDVQVMIDVSNLPPGEYTRDIKLNLPRFIKYGGDLSNLQATVVISTIPEPGSEDGTDDTATDPESESDPDNTAETGTKPETGEEPESTPEEETTGEDPNDGTVEEETEPTDSADGSNETGESVDPQEEEQGSEGSEPEN